MPDMWERARVRHESTPVPEELEFAVASALRAGQRRLRGRRALRRSVSGVLGGCACFVLLVNASPAFARAVSDVPVLGGLARVVTVTEYHIDERERLIDVRLPALELPGDTDLEQRINLAIQTRIDQVLQEAEDRARAIRDAYVATGGAEEDFIPVMIDVDYEIKCQNDHYLSFVLTETETRANAYTELYTYNIDLQAGRELTLRDMLGPDYKELANEAVRATSPPRRRRAPTTSTSTGRRGWRASPPSPMTSAFYINEAGNPVLIFEKYEIAPGYMGQPEFEVPMPKTGWAAGAPCAGAVSAPAHFLFLRAGTDREKRRCV